MSETPRMDAAEMSYIPNITDHPQAIYCVPVHLARELERELTAARRTNVELAEMLAKERAELAALRAALECLCVPYNESVDRYKGVPSGVYVQRFRFEQARAALAAAGGAK